jgi:hypothetical protein
MKATRTVIEDLLPQVRSKLANIGPDDIVIVQCLDNSSYYARYEDGGDVPVTRNEAGQWHVEADLVLATVERQKILFANIEPLLQLLVNHTVILVTPMPRWLYIPCCSREDHAPNRRKEGFERALREDLHNYRRNMKDFAFRRNLRIRVIDPSPVLQYLDENGEEIWEVDPVHPTELGYHMVADVIVEAFKRGGGHKRPGDRLQPPAKRAKPARRPDWVSGVSEVAVRREWVPGHYRGQGDGMHRGRGGGDRGGRRGGPRGRGGGGRGGGRGGGHGGGGGRGGGRPYRGGGY